MNLWPLARTRPPQPLARPRLAFMERSPAGVRFTERMTGWWSPAQRVPRSRHDPMKRQDYEDAFEAGRREGRSLELVLTIATEDLEWTLRHPHHRFRFTGTAAIAGLPGALDVQTLMARGVFNLFQRHRDAISSKQMAYVAHLAAHHGDRWRFSGFKSIRQGGGVGGFGDDEHRGGLWRDQTRLYFKLWRRTRDAAPPLALGVATLGVSDFLRQLRTIRATGTSDVIESYDTVARFLVFFGGVLRDTYGGPLARSRYAPPNWWRRKPRRLTARTMRAQDPRAPELVATAEDLLTEDGATLRLTRYSRADGQRPGKGPVLLAPGFGVRAASFATDTVDLNIVEFLSGHDYDVWLFDYRASPDLETSSGDFSIDHIAAFDWPSAIRRVCETTGLPVKVIAHCVGAMSFMMSALGKHLEPPSIATAILSQVGAHPIGDRINELKAFARFAFWLRLFGAKSIRVTIHAADTYRRPPLDRLLKYWRTPDPCDNPVCRRVRFVFGESYLHANLTRKTHDAIIEMFGNPNAERAELKAAYASLRALRQLASIVEHRQVVYEDGRRYLDGIDVGEVLTFPLCLMSGSKNAIFPPDGIKATHAFLKGRIPHLQEVLTLDTYAHMDCFIGANACDDVFPKLLERFPRPLERL